MIGRLANHIVCRAPRLMGSSCFWIHVALTCSWFQACKLCLCRKSRFSTKSMNDFPVRTSLYLITVGMPPPQSLNTWMRFVSFTCVIIILYVYMNSGTVFILVMINKINKNNTASQVIRKSPNLFFFPGAETTYGSLYQFPRARVRCCGPSSSQRPHLLRLCQGGSPGTCAESSRNAWNRWESTITHKSLMKG